MRTQIDALDTFSKREVLFKEKTVTYYTSFEESSKEKPYMVFLHGWVADSSAWALVGEKIKEELNVVLVDLPGHGKSQVPTDELQISYMVDSVHEVIQQLGTRIFLVGHSMGSAITQAYALKYPENLLGIGLVSTTLSFSTFIPPQVMEVLIPQGKKWWESVVESTLKNFSKIIFGDKSGENRHLLNAASQVIMQTPEEVVDQTYRNIIYAWDNTKEAENIQLPTLILVGSDDRLTPVSQGLKVCQKIPHAYLKEIEGTSHHITLLRPNEVVDNILYFFRCELL